MHKSSHWIPTLPKFQAMPLPLASFYSILFHSLYRTDQETPLHIFATLPKIPKFSPTSSGGLSKQCLFLWLPSIPVSPKASYTDRSSFWSLRTAVAHVLRIYRWTKHVLLCPMCDTSELEPLVLRRTTSMLLCCMYYTCAQELRMHFCPLPHSDLWPHIEA